jgi:mono/diheme cytochrome c family protein
MSLRRSSVAWFLLTCLAVVGCGKSMDSSSNNAPAASSGNAVFDAHCAKCHTLTGSGSGPKKKGPDLSKAGADPVHTVDWIAEHIRNPKSHEPKSTMPPFADTLKPEEIKALAEFLAAKK